MMSDKPNYETDVHELKSEFNMWERTYSYRGIKYNIAMLQIEHSRWVVVECPEETLDIVELVCHTDMVRDFLYRTCEPEEGDLLMDVFYKAIECAEADINWFLDECLDDIVQEIRYYNRLYDNVSNAIESIDEEGV